MSKEVARRQTEVIRPHLIRYYPDGGPAPKRAIRRMMGWKRPIRCPKCKMYTKQQAAPVRMGQVITKRECLSCGTVFTRAESRQQLKRDRRAA